MLPSYDGTLIQALILDYFRENEAAQIYRNECDSQGWPLVIDHMTIRCMNVDQRAKEFQSRGYVYKGELIEYPDRGWWAKVYRKEGYPALFIDQAYSDSKGDRSIFPLWVETFGDRVLHHVAVLVKEIEEVISVLQKRGVTFSGDVVGRRGTRLRQVFTASEVRNGIAFSVLELTERNGYDGFYPEQTDSLMQSSVKMKS